MLADAEAIAEDAATEGPTLNNENYIPKFEVRLYKETKFSPYKVVYDEDIADIIAKQFTTRVGADKATKQFLAENQAALLFKKDNTYKSAQTGFMSMYKYDAQEVNDYLKTNGTFEGFSGKLEQDWWYFDFDSAKGIDACGSMLIPMLTDFTVKGIPFLLFNSGFHGWHLYMPKGIVSIAEGCEKYSDNQKNKVLAEEICNSYKLTEDSIPNADGEVVKKPIVDRGIYNFTTAFRMPFSRNEKSTRIKREYIFVTLQQIMQEREAAKAADPTLVFQPVVTSDHYRPILNNLDMFNMTIEQLLKPYDLPVKPVMQLTEKMFENVTKIDRVIAARNFEHPMYEKVCIYRMLNTPELSNRALTALRLIYYWKEKYYDEEDTLALLRGWNRKLQRPLAERELLHAMKSYRLTFHLCKDNICLQYCPMTDKCVYNKTRLVDDNTIKDCKMQIAEYDQSQKADKSKWITFSKLYPGNPIVLKPKEILGICGANGIGKSIVVDDILVRSKKFSVFLCWEMNAAQLVGRRLIQFGNLDMTLNKDRELYYELTEHIIIIEKKFPIQRLPDIIARIEQKYNRKVEVIGMDYLQIQPVADPNNMNRFIRNGTERADFMAEYLPEAMKDIDASMVMCGQPKQSLEGFGVVPLTGEAFKNGQACAAMCGKMMTILRPFKGTNYDNAFSMWVVKNRDGETSGILNYNWTGKQMLIGGPFSEEITHKDPITFDND